MCSSCHSKFLAQEPLWAHRTQGGCVGWGCGAGVQLLEVTGRFLWPLSPVPAGRCPLVGVGCPSVCCWASGVMLGQPEVRTALFPSEQRHGPFMVGFTLWGSDQFSLFAQGKAGSACPSPGSFALGEGTGGHRSGLVQGVHQFLTLQSPHCSLERRWGRALFRLCWGSCTAVEQRGFSWF